jgi:hypothetical protein
VINQFSLIHLRPLRKVEFRNADFYFILAVKRSRMQKNLQPVLNKPQRLVSSALRRQRQHQQAFPRVSGRITASRKARGQIKKALRRTLFC